MKLNINENFDSTTSIGTNLNPISPITPMNVFEIGDFDVYKQYADLDSASGPIEIIDDAVNDVCDNTTNIDEETVGQKLEKLGFVFLLASNDIHTIHINATGENFEQLHREANELYYRLSEYSDVCLEMSCEDGHYIHNINTANCDLNLDWSCFVEAKGYTLKDGVCVISEILSKVLCWIDSIYNLTTSNVQSTLDEWTRYIESKRNYFLDRILKENKSKKTLKNESIMSAAVRNLRRNRKALMKESLEYLELGKAYKDFYQVEDHIADYDVDPEFFEKGDYIIRDFQFGHLPNGGNKGYIPYEVVDIEYDRDEQGSGYWDSRKRLHLFDGKEDFYIVCQNGKFNGMFHRLKDSSIKK